MKASLQKKKKKKSQFWRTPGFKGKQQTHKIYIYIYISMLRALTPHLAVAMRQPWPLQPHLALIQHLPLIKFIILKTHHQSITHYQTFELILGFVQDPYLNPWFNPQVSHYKRTYECLRALGLNHGRPNWRVR